MTPQEKDRNMQVYLAQARGPVRNGNLLRQAVDRMLAIRAGREGKDRNSSMDDSLIESLASVANVLEDLDVPYAVTGSVASSVHGEASSTYDADIVLLASPRHASLLSSKLQPRFYAPEDMLLEAVSNNAFTNIVDNRTSLKVDLSFVGNDPFLLEVLRRRIRCNIGDDPRAFWFVTPEDVILMKLLWRIETRSAKQWENALGVARIKGARMDWKYLFEKAQALGIEDQLIKLRDEAGI